MPSLILVCPNLADLYFLAFHFCYSPAVLSRLPRPGLSGLSRLGCPILVVLSLLSCSSRPVFVVLFRLPCPFFLSSRCFPSSCHVPAVLRQCLLVPSPGYPVVTVLSRLPGLVFSATLFWSTHLVFTCCLVPPGLRLISCSAYPVPAI